MNNEEKQFIRKSELNVMIIGVITVIIIGIFDYLSGHELGLAPLYFIPLFFVTWNANIRQGVYLSIISTIVWFFADIMARPIEPNYFILIWNAGIRLFIFTTFTYALSLIRISQNRQKELMEFIVHDLRTPMMIISEVINFLREELLDKMNEKQKKFLMISRISCKRANDLINSILDLSKLEAGKMEPEIENIRINEFVEEAIEEISVLSSRSDVRVIKKNDTDITEIRSDKGLLFRVLINLLSNAVKVSQPKGTVTVRIFVSDKSSIAISVVDEGKGIPKEISDKLFSRFVQARSREKGYLVGSGLGLSFCKLAVEALGGNVCLESKEGKGTVVTVRLPLENNEVCKKNN